MNSGAESDDSLLLRFARTKFEPCNVYFNSDYRVQGLNGNLDKYGLLQCLPGHDVRVSIPFLYGLSCTDSLNLEFLEMPNGLFVNATLRRHADNVELLLTDASFEHEQHQALQQKSNEARLLAEKQKILLQELAEKNAEADRLNTLQSRFIANMSHEFRTPLCSIAAYATYLKEDTVEIDVPRCAVSIDRATQHLLNLVDNLIDQAQFELGEIQLNPVPLQVSQIIDDMRALFSAAANSKGLRFEACASTRVPHRVNIDETRLRQVVINLLGNAVKYTSEGSVQLALDYDAGDLRVNVSDSGKGIASAALATIFKPFTRDNAKQYGGAGLGLNIAKRLVCLMGGDIEIESTLGIGTSVSFHVSAPPVVETAAGALQGEASRCVLVVEDDSDVYDILEIYLDDAGYEVYHADSAAAALEVARNVSLVSTVTDLNLPDMSGISLSRELRKSGFAGPIIMLTASSLSSDRSRAMRAGCTEFLVKPIQPRRLIELLERSQLVLQTGERS